MPYSDNGKIVTDIQYLSNDLTVNKVKVSSQIYYWNKNKDAADSMLIIKYDLNQSYLTKQADKLSFTLEGAHQNSFIESDFKKCLLRTQSYPVGEYKIYTTISFLETNKIIQKQFTYRVDSVLANNSFLHRQFFNTIKPNNILGLTNLEEHPVNKTASKFLQSKKGKIRKLEKKYGVKSETTSLENEDRINFYQDRFYLGYIAVPASKDISSFLKEEELSRLNLSNNFSIDELPAKQSLSADFRELYKQNKEEDNILMGNIRLGSTFNNDYDEFSKIDNQVYEVQGDVSIPIFGIPVQVNGYYTTQDRNRLVKSSFINFNYDKQRAQQQLTKLISQYKNKYEVYKGQGASYEMVFSNYRNNLKSNKNKLSKELLKSYGLDLDNINNLSEEQKGVIKQKIEDKLLADKNNVALDSLNNGIGQAKDSALALKAKVEKEYEKIMEKYNQAMAIQEKIEQYSGLIEQLRTKVKLDSLLAYQPIKELRNMEDMSNKEILKKASALFPDGKAKTFLSGLNNLEIGIFSKYVSKYTLGGQTVKGIDIGYDVGFADLAVTYGRTEYVDRNGLLEGYKTISTRVNSKPVWNQVFGFGYNTFSAEKNLIIDERFIGSSEISIPSFLNPINVLSFQHSGTIGKYVILNTEAAYSDIKNQSEEAAIQYNFLDATAINSELEFMLPKVDANLSVNYERIGAGFENRVLAMNPKGLERLSTKLDAFIFRSVLKVGLEYNLMVQKNQYFDGKQSKWGFDIRTHFKRFPNVSISYKPFTTFRSIYDTLNIPQRAMIGSVWNARLVYQHKNKERLLRLSAIFNQSSSTYDTTFFQSRVAQMQFTFIKQNYSIMLNVGANKVHSSHQEVGTYPAYNDNQFIMIQSVFKVSEQVSIGGGCDIARSAIGLSKYGVNINAGYLFKKIPIGLRVFGRYSSFMLEQAAPWKNIYGGGLELNYRLFSKLN